MSNTFNTHAGYWLGKEGVPDGLRPLLTPYCDRGLTLLDLGCGGGRLAKSLVESYRKVCGVDSATELVRQAALHCPRATFTCGDFQLAETWRNWSQPFDVIVSNCALRRDYSPHLAKVFSLCRQHLAPQGAMLLRIQAFEDLHTLLPAELRQRLFYNEQELHGALGDGWRVHVSRETFQQPFSSPHYVRAFLERIDVPYSGSSDRTTHVRNYYLLSATPVECT